MSFQLSVRHTRQNTAAWSPSFMGHPPPAPAAVLLVALTYAICTADVLAAGLQRRACQGLETHVVLALICAVPAAELLELDASDCYEGAPLPDNEEERLQALAELDIMDTPPGRHLHDVGVCTWGAEHLSGIRVCTWGAEHLHDVGVCTWGAEHLSEVGVCTWGAEHLAEVGVCTWGAEHLQEVGVCTWGAEHLQEVRVGTWGAEQQSLLKPQRTSLIWGSLAECKPCLVTLILRLSGAEEPCRRGRVCWAGKSALDGTSDPVGPLGQAGRTILEPVQKLPTPVPPAQLRWTLLAALHVLNKIQVVPLLRVAFTVVYRLCARPSRLRLGWGVRTRSAESG